MNAASFELQKALHAALSTSSELTALLGGAKIYDRVPRPAAVPYVVFGPHIFRDWSTGTEEGSEHVVTLHVWSKQGGERETFLIVDVIRATLRTATLTLTGYRLVNLRFESAECAREEDGETYLGSLRVRAVLEPVA